MTTLSLSGDWQGNPTHAGLVRTCDFTLTQNGNSVTGKGTGWLGANYGQPSTSIGWTLTGEVTGNSFVLQSSGSDLPLKFTGTIDGQNAISGTLVGELEPGGTTTAPIACVQLDFTYPSSVTGRWQGTTDDGQSLSLSPVQSGDGTSGVGSASIQYQGRTIDFTGFVSGQVNYPSFSLQLQSIPETWGQISVTFVGQAQDENTLAGTLTETGTAFTLTRQTAPADGGKDLGAQQLSE
jgi:hypothetical protein